MTRLSIRIKSFYLITSFLLVVFLFYPLKTFANVTTHTIITKDGNSPFPPKAQVISGDKIRIYSELVKSEAINNTKITTNGFYSENTKWVSPVFSSSQNLDIPNLHVVSWGTTGTKEGKLSLTTASSNLLRLEVASDVILKGFPTDSTIFKNNFFPKGNKTTIGFPMPSNGSFTAGINQTAIYTVNVVSVSAPSISSFAASIPPASLVSPQSYKLISGNPFTLDWKVANATATTQCTLKENGSNLKTFDNTDADATNDFTLSGTTVSFGHTISSLTADATYNVSCTHNGVGIPATSSVSIDVVPAPSVNTFTANGKPGEPTITPTNESSPRFIGMWDTFQPPPEPLQRFPVRRKNR